MDALRVGFHHALQQFQLFHRLECRADRVQARERIRKARPWGLGRGLGSPRLDGSLLFLLFLFLFLFLLKIIVGSIWSTFSLNKVLVIVIVIVHVRSPFLGAHSALIREVFNFHGFPT